MATKIMAKPSLSFSLSFSVKDNCLPSSSGSVTLPFVDVPTPSWKTGRFFASGDSEEWSGRKGKRDEEEKGGREQEPNLRDSIREESAAKASGENKGSLRGRWGGRR